MKSHITEAGDPVSRHLALEDRDFPAGGTWTNGRVLCSQCRTASFVHDLGPPAGWEYVEAAGIGAYRCPEHIRPIIGRRVRTTFDGEEFPGVYKIVSITDGNAQLQSEHDDTITYAPIEELVVCTSPPPGPLSHKQEHRVRDFATFVRGMDDEQSEAALTLLAALLET